MAARRGAAGVRKLVVYNKWEVFVNLLQDRDY